MKRITAMIVLCVALMAVGSAVAEQLPYFSEELLGALDMEKTRAEAIALLKAASEEMKPLRQLAEKDVVLRMRLEQVGRMMETLIQDISPEAEREQMAYAVIGMAEIETMRWYFQRLAAVRNRPSRPTKIFDVTQFGACGDGRTDNTKAFADTLQAVLQYEDSHDCTLMIPDGVYYFSEPLRNIEFQTDFISPPEEGGGLTGFNQASAFIVLANHRNLTIRGGDSTLLLFNTPTYESGIRLGACENVTIQNVKIDYRPHPFTQGTIVECSAEDRSVVLETDDPDAAKPDMAFFKRGHTWSFTPDGQFIWKYGYFMHVKAERLDENRIRYFFRKDGSQFEMLRPGLKLAHPSRWTSAAVQLNFCQFCRMENVTVYAAPGLTFSDANGVSNEYVNCRIERKEGRLISSNGDGFHVASGLVGPVIMGCFGEWFDDDGVNCYSRAAVFNEKLDDTMWILSDNVPFPSSLIAVLNRDNGQVKAFARVIDYHGGYCFKPAISAVTQKDIESGNGGDRKTSDGALCLSRLTLAPVIIDTHFSNHYGTSFVMQAPFAIVENCSSENPSQAGIAVRTVGDWNEFSSPHNVVCRNNQISGGAHCIETCYRVAGSGTDYSKCAPLRHLRFLNNKYKAPRSGQAEIIDNAPDVLLRDNVLVEADDR